ncbi:acetyl-CoA carboxylase alpha subunit [Amycolatopsis jiangsuensis]|uniref:Acetyl-CoA carboxylase alpha subunit n=1 Tax=Amycolatopsis jiangsuensis TaxID=1181879 RepID=A0A840IZ87_9PSEU|nr:acetyl-CoA carboxylase alpha subunit [Amycolatopsis jiangsuensis]
MPRNEALVLQPDFVIGAGGGGGCLEMGAADS